ncbi:hypothetical protein [Streptomyces sp. NPDC101234]|uniref:hypothetical protein n=1 Tax=Streptomyces sp. NPDC101234 TaxID=3366138 RepID=UPI0038157172
MKSAAFVQGGKRQSGVVADFQTYPFEYPVDLLDPITEGEKPLGVLMYPGTASRTGNCRT